MARTKPVTISSNPVSGLRSDLAEIYPPPDPSLNMPAALPETFGGMDDFASEEDELRAMLSTLGTGEEEGSVTLMVFSDESKKREWVAQKPASEFLSLGVPWVAKNFGPGMYEAIIYGPDKRMRARKKISISKKTADFYAEKKPDDSAALTQVVVAMREGFTQLGQLIAQSAQKPASEKEFLERLAMYKQLFAPANQQNSGGMLDQMKAAIEFVKDLQPRTGEPGFADAFMKFVDKFGEPISRALTERMSVPAAALPEPSQPAPGTVVGGPSQLENAEMFQAQMLKMYLNLLIDSAQQEADPYTYAGLICDKVPQSMLLTWLAKPDLAEELSKIDARVMQYPQWFAELKKNIEEILSSEGASGD